MLPDSIPVFKAISTDVGGLSPDIVRIPFPTDAPKIIGSARSKAAGLFVRTGLINRYEDAVYLLRFRDGLHRIEAAVKAVGFVSSIRAPESLSGRCTLESWK